MTAFLSSSFPKVYCILFYLNLKTSLWYDGAGLRVIFTFQVWDSPKVKGQSGVETGESSWLPFQSLFIFATLNHLVGPASAAKFHFNKKRGSQRTQRLRPSLRWSLQITENLQGKSDSPELFHFPCQLRGGRSLKGRKSQPGPHHWLNLEFQIRETPSSDGTSHFWCPRGAHSESTDAFFSFPFAARRETWLRHPLSLASCEWWVILFGDLGRMCWRERGCGWVGTSDDEQKRRKCELVVLEEAVLKHHVRTYQPVPG